MALHTATGDFRRVSNRCMVVWFVTLCTAMLLMLTINSIGHYQPQQVAGWLQAAQKHVQNLGMPDSLDPLPLPPAASNISKPPLYPPGFRLSNLDNFTFVINNDVCGDAAVDAVMVVTSDTRRPSVRDAIREALPSSVLAELRMRRVFLLAELAPPANADTMYDRRVGALQAENHEHGDLVVGSFRDAYRNLTYKHLMGLHWATTYCPQTQYIIKMDHDIAVDVFQLHERLMTAPPGYRDKLVIGAVFAGTGPIRDSGSKWYVTKEEFAPESYPAYMSGWLYAITPDAAARLVAAAARIPFFWVDDAFVTGIVRDQAVKDLRMVDFDQIWGRPDDTGMTSSPFTMQIGCLYQCAAEPEASVSRCDTLVGPALNNLLVMRMFMKQAEYCYRRRCGRRSRMPSICNTGTAEHERPGMPQQPRDIGDVDS